MDPLSVAANALSAGSMRPAQPDRTVKDRLHEVYT